MKIKEKDFLKDPLPGRWKLVDGFYVKIEDIKEIKPVEEKTEPAKKSGSDDPGS